MERARVALVMVIVGIVALASASASASLAASGLARPSLALPVFGTLPSGGSDVGAAPADDACAGGADAPGARPGHLLALPVSCDGAFGGSYDTDLYGIESDGSHVLRLHATFDAEASLSVADEGRSYVHFIGSAPVTEAALRLQPGRSALALSGEGAYHLEAALEPFTDSPDCGRAGDAPDLRLEFVDGYRYAPTTPLSTVATDATCAGTLDVGDREDAYVLELPGDQVLSVELARASATGGRMAAVALPLGGSPIYGVRSAEAGPDDLDVTLELLDTGRPGPWLLFVVAERPGLNVSLPYALTLSTRAPAPADDCATGQELPLAPVATHVLPAGADCFGTFAEGDVGDSLLLEALPGPRVLSLDADLPLWSGAELERNGIATWAVYRTLDSSQERTLQYVTPDDALALRMRPLWYQPDGPYRVRYEYLPDPQDDCGVGHDAARAHGAYEAVVESGTCAGGFLPGDTVDAIRFRAEPGDLVQIDITGPSSAVLVDPTTGASRYTNVWAGRPGADVLAFLYGYGSSNYTLQHTRVHESTLDDCGSGRDAGNGTDPVRLGKRAACEGELTTRVDGSDVYAIEMAPGEALLVRGTIPDHVYLSVYEDGQQSRSTRILVTNVLVHVSETGGTAYVQVLNAGLGQARKPYAFDAIVIPAGLA